MDGELTIQGCIFLLYFKEGGDAKQNCGPKYRAELLDYSTRPASQVFKKNWNGEGRKEELIINTWNESTATEVQ